MRWAKAFTLQQSRFRVSVSYAEGYLVHVDKLQMAHDKTAVCDGMRAGCNIIELADCLTEP